MDSFRQESQMSAADARNMFSRLNDIFETDILRDRRATVIGLGTGGSLAAVELAKCAVGKFRLVDFDVLEAHNVVRHACGLRDLKRFKVDAVKDAILNFNPQADVETHVVDVLSPEVDLRRILLGSDVVLPCTDSERSKYHINKELLDIWFQEKVSLPAIYAGAYERAFGGDVMRVIPGETPCYDCVIGSVQQLPFMASRPKSAVPYTDLQSSDEFRAEPGLGLDVHFIVLIQVKLALMTLLRGTPSLVGDLPYNFVFWGNRKEWIFPEPFKAIFATTESRDDCATCGVRAREVLGTAGEAISQQGAEILRRAREAAAASYSGEPEVAEVELPPDLRKHTES